jgi:hypothetical protein
MLSWGLLVIIVNVVYILLSMLIGYLAYKFFKHKYKHIGKIVFIVVLLAPFWDLIIQKSVKTYYQAFKMEGEIYAYPEVDADGKIESLGIDKISSFSTSGYLTERERFSNLRKRYKVSKILEIYMINSFDKKNEKGEIVIKRDYKNDIGYVRISLNNENINYELISNQVQFKSRYQVLGEEYDYNLFKKYNIQIWDKKNELLLTEGFKLEFNSSKEKFRNKILLWKSANNSEYRISSLDNYNLLFKNLFGFRLN